MDGCNTIDDGNSYCLCSPKKHYCGHELTAFRMERYENHSLYLCDDRGQIASQIETCPSECKSDLQSFCSQGCELGKWYCGRELSALDWKTYDNDTIYECGENNQLKIVETCSSCRKVNGYPTCDGHCILNHNYCGYRMKEIGLRSYDNDTLYMCNGENATMLAKCAPGTCHSSGCKCQPNRLYCGHELYWQLGWRNMDDYDASVLYRCKSDGSKAEYKTRCPQSCIGGETDIVCGSDECQPSRCGCKKSDHYCGHELIVVGWRGYENRTIYECDADNSVKRFKTCHSQCIGTETYSICAQECIDGSQYCGSTLHKLGYDGYKNASVYICRDPNSPLVDTGTSNILCVGQCAPNRTYCGYEIRDTPIVVEKGLRLQDIYKCHEDGTFESVAVCSSCATSNERIARCSTPWYWILGGATLALVFVILASVLLRVGSKHRRLQQSIESQRIDANQLEATDVLGKGEFGEVWRATYKKRRGTEVDVAVKVSNEKTGTASKLACADCFVREMTSLNILSHPNIIRAFGTCTNFKDRSGNTVPALVLEYMNGGSAISYLRTERNRTTGRDLLHIVADIARAGVHLCKLGIIHRDIAARNVLVQKDTANGRVKVAKLTDFGLAKDIGTLRSNYKSAHPERSLFHCRYTAPEAISGSYSSKSDVWSFGILVWELYTVLEESRTTSGTGADSDRPGPTPYSATRDPAEVLEQVRTGLKLRQPRLTPDAIYDKMVECWAKTPESRPSFKELLKFFEFRRGTRDVGSQVILEPVQFGNMGLSNVGAHEPEELEMRICRLDGYVSAA